MTTSPCPARRTASSASVAALLATLLLVLAAAPVAAHARLTDSAPGAGATLDDPPDEVVLTFNEEVEADFNQIQVRDPDGARVDAGAAEGHGMEVRAALQALTVPGTYIVAFRVISADGHPVEGTFEFDLTEEALAGALPAQEPTADPESAPTEDAGTGGREAEDGEGEDPDQEPAPLDETPAVDDEGGLRLALIAVGVLIALGAVALISTRRGGAREDEPPA